MQNDEAELQDALQNHQGRIKKVSNLGVDRESQVSPVQDYFQLQPNTTPEYGFSKILPTNHIPKTSLLDGNDVIIGDFNNVIIDTQDIIIDVFDDSQAIHDHQLGNVNELVVMEQKDRMQMD